VKDCITPLPRALVIGELAFEDAIRGSAACHPRNGHSN
jgi:hypothetical protein